MVATWKENAKKTEKGHSAKSDTDRTDPKVELCWDENIVEVCWGSGSNCWFPKGGCWRAGCWPSNWEGKLGIGLNMKRARPLPLVLVAKEPTEAEKKQLATMVEDYLAASYIREWDWEKGYPSVVIPLHVIPQGTKTRVISDMRYCNSCIENEELVVPTIKLIAEYIGQDDLLLKLDLKAGYHQMALVDKVGITFAHEGKLYEYIVPPFGGRHLPGRFQRHTRAVADALEKEFRLKCFVYLDDFFLVCRKGITPPAREEILRAMTAFGLVIGLPKSSTGWGRKTEVLGIVVDTETMMLTLSTRKKNRILAELEEALSDRGTWDTLRQAQLLGRLVSIEPAVKNVMLASRPGFNDLAVALGKDHLLDLLNLNIDINYAWNVVPLTMSSLSRMAFTLLKDKFESWHGRPAKFEASVNVEIQTDAGEYGAGTVRVDIAGNVLDTSGMRLPDELVGESSLVREAWAFTEGLRRIPKATLKGARIGAQVDNQGLASRFAKGVSCPLTTDILVNALFFLTENDAELVFVRWVPRENNTLADLKSKEGLGAEDVMRVQPSTFAQIFEGEREKPNIDGLASQDDKVVQRYCSIDRQDRHSGGNFFEWRQEKGDIVWMHPPLPIIRRTIKKWYEGESELAYVLVPRIPHARWASLIDALNGELYYTEVKVDRGATTIGAHWKFDVYRLRK